MSFRADLRRTQDPERSLAQRRASLNRCIRAYAPFGFAGTTRHLEDVAGPLDSEAGLDAAAVLLAASRGQWLVTLADFAARRHAAKLTGTRRPSGRDLDTFTNFGWPGGAEACELDDAFLARFGLVAWASAPVNLRRQLRRAEREAVAPTDAGCLPAALIVGESGLGLLAWWFFSPPALFWYAFLGTSAVFLLLAVVTDVRKVRDPDRLSARIDRSHRMDVLSRRLDAQPHKARVVARRVVVTVLCYIVRDGELLVVRAGDAMGVQVPNGVVRTGESPSDAALRAARELTGLQDLHLVRKVGVDDYDLSPQRSEIHRRHAFHLTTSVRPPGSEIFWIPIERAHVLQSGQGALLGKLVESRSFGQVIGDLPGDGTVSAEPL
jgi:NUDIX domain